MSQPQDMSKYTAAAQWSTTAADTESDLKLPSGALCRVRKPGMEEIMMSGMIDLVDTLGMETEKLIDPAERKKKQQQAIVASKGGHRKKGEEEDSSNDFMRQMSKDPLGFKRMMLMVDKIAAMTVVIPQVLPMPTKKNPAWTEGSTTELEYISAPELKQDGSIYTDAISFEDKFALMDYGMGDLDKLKQFRDTSDSVGAVQPGEGDDGEAVLATGDLL